MDDGLSLLLFAIFAGGAILVTLFAAFAGRGDEGERAEGHCGTEEPDYPEEHGSDIGEAMARLAATEARIEKLLHLIEYTGHDAARAKEGDIIARERTLLAYLVDVADKRAALILRRSYRDEADWLMSLLDDQGWMEATTAFREKLLREHEAFASKSYFRTHPALDEALSDILADFDRATTRLLAEETSRLFDDETPIAEAASIRMREDEEALATIIAELDSSFDRFSARLELISVTKLVGAPPFFASPAGSTTATPSVPFTTPSGEGEGRRAARP